MVNNKKYFAHMLSLALVVCTASVLTGPVDQAEEVEDTRAVEEEKKTKTFKKYRYYLNEGHANKEWMPKKVMNEMEIDVNNTLDIIDGLDEDPNMRLVDDKYPCPHNVLVYASYLVPVESNGYWLGCNTKLIEELLIRGGDPKIKNDDGSTRNALEVVEGHVNSWISEEIRDCAKKVKIILLNACEINELTDNEKAYKDYEEYLKKQQEKKNDNNSSRWFW